MGWQCRTAGVAVARLTYATEVDMFVRFGEETLAQLCPPDLPDPGGPQGEGAPSLAAALADATELIDSYAAGRYRVPLNPVPAPVRRWCADIARWFLDRARTDESIRQAYEDALVGLKDMSRGIIVFQCEGQATADTPNGQVLMAGPERMFSMQSLKGY